MTFLSHPPMTNFLTVSEAAKLVGKSPSSIRRIIYPILNSDQHPDRQQIKPGPEEAKALRLKGENFPWRVSEGLLRRHVPEPGAKPASEPKAGAQAAGDGSALLIEMLRRELDIKNRQLDTQNEVLKGLSERLREGNILIGSLQQQLALPDGNRKRPEVVDESGNVERGAASGESEPVNKPKKRSLLARILRR